MCGKRTIFLAAVVVIAGLAAWSAAMIGYAYFQVTANVSGSDETPVVAVSKPVVREVTYFEEILGHTEANLSVEIRPRVTGYLTRIGFHPGQSVRNGDTLFEIDDLLYRWDVGQRRAEVLKSEARLQFANAEQERAQQKLANKQISPEEFDRIRTQQIEAQADQTVAKIAQQRAEFLLECTRVRAPIDGQMGRLLLNHGSVAVADSSVLTTIISVESLHVVFDVPEPVIWRLKRRTGEGKDPANARSAISIHCRFADDRETTAVLNAMDNCLNPATGTLRCCASIPNPEKHLLPGMSVRVKIDLSEPYQVLLVPQRAIGTKESGAKYVFTVTEQDVLKRCAVRCGAIQDGQQIVLEGLKPEEPVVVGDPNELKDGMKVKITQLSQ